MVLIGNENTPSFEKGVKIITVLIKPHLVTYNWKGLSTRSLKGHFLHVTSLAKMAAAFTEQLWHAAILVMNVVGTFYKCHYLYGK